MSDSTAPRPTVDPNIVARLEESRALFLAVVRDIRPDLHRYCARMTGSIMDGEDVVQDTLARAYFQLAEFGEQPPPLRPWLFRIAHNCAIDHIRRAAYRATRPLEEALDLPADDAAEPDQAFARSQATRAAVSMFLGLPPSQRAAVVLSDVLECTLDEIAAHLDTTVPAVKAALFRGRRALRTRLDAPVRADPAPPPPKALARYVALFNAHDWDGVRAMLADDVHLDLVSRRRLTGARSVGQYFSNYEREEGWFLTLDRLEGREIVVVDQEDRGAVRKYFIELDFFGDRVAAIRDYRHVPYIARDAP